MKEFNFSCDSGIDGLTWGPFLETPETFWVYFGCCNFLRISKTKTFPGVKFCNKFALSYLEIIVKGQLSRISGWQFLKWLFGPESLRDFRERSVNFFFCGLGFVNHEQIFVNTENLIVTHNQ